MASKTIPAKTVLVCDRCGCEGEEKDPDSPFYNGGTRLRGQSWCRGLMGETGGSERTIDLCCKCSTQLDTFLVQESLCLPEKLVQGLIQDLFWSRDPAAAKHKLESLLNGLDIPPMVHNAIALLAQYAQQNQQILKQNRTEKVHRPEPEKTP